MKWREVVGYEGLYEVNEAGQIKSLYTGKIRAHALNRFNGYLVIPLSKDKQKRLHYVHRIVAAAFIGPCPDGMEVAHLNEIKTDPRAANLSYVTHSNNARQWFSRIKPTRKANGTFEKFHRTVGPNVSLIQL